MVKQIHCTGVAPYGVAKAGGKIYVTNWAGAVPGETDKNVAGVPWGNAKVDPKTGATREGTVSVFNPDDGKLLKEITVGLHPNDMIASPDENYLYVANANSDDISVICTATDAVSETISVRLGDEKNPYWGDSPNGLGISGDGKTLYVANGMDNAVAVVTLGKNASAAGSERQSRVAGFIPTGAYPGGVCVYRDNRLYVPNIEAEGARIPTVSESGTTIPLDEMNKELSQLKGQALHFAKKSLEQQFDGVDTGNDDLFNRIIWFAMNGNKPYPAKYCGKFEDK